MGSKSGNFPLQLFLSWLVMTDPNSNFLSQFSTGPKWDDWIDGNFVAVIFYGSQSGNFSFGYFCQAQIFFFFTALFNGAEFGNFCHGYFQWALSQRLFFTVTFDRPKFKVFLLVLFNGARIR